MAKPFKRLVGCCLDCNIGAGKSAAEGRCGNPVPSEASWGKCLATDVSSQTQFWGVHEKLGAVVHTCNPRLGAWKRIGRSLGCCYLV